MQINSFGEVMSKKTRGFAALKGVTIAKIDAGCINQVVLTDSDGSTYTIESEAGPLGIPSLSLVKSGTHKNPKTPKTDPWPYPEDKTLD